MIINKKTGYFLGGIVFLLLIASMAYLFIKVDDLDKRTKEFSETFFTQSTDIEQMRNAKQLAYDPSSNMLYFPELRIKLPYSSLARSFSYSMRLDDKNNEIQEADVASNRFQPSPDLTVLDCTHFLRLSIEDKPNPYNPAEKPYSYNLNDGRKLQIYVFTGELDGNRECKIQYDSQRINPTDFLKAFTGVQSY